MKKSAETNMSPMVFSWTKKNLLKKMPLQVVICVIYCSLSHTHYSCDTYRVSAKKPKKSSRKFDRLRRVRSTVDRDDMLVIEESRKRPRDEDEDDERIDDFISEDDDSVISEGDEEENPRVVILSFYLSCSSTIAPISVMLPFRC